MYYRGLLSDALEVLFTYQVPNPGGILKNPISLGGERYMQSYA